MVRYLLVVIVALIPLGAKAEASAIPPMYILVAEENQVPAKLFYALILNESRSKSVFGGQSKVLPWPWTINHQGKPYFFPNRIEAYQFAESLLKNGDPHFDVGLGQINWRWHNERFSGLWNAFDPYTNLSAAAKHFREQFERPECGTWELAVGCYHRPGQRDRDKEIAKAYTQRVITLWTNI